MWMLLLEGVWYGPRNVSTNENDESYNRVSSVFTQEHSCTIDYDNLPLHVHVLLCAVDMHPTISRIIWAAVA